MQHTDNFNTVVKRSVKYEKFFKTSYRHHSNIFEFRPARETCAPDTRHREQKFSCFLERLTKFLRYRETVSGQIGDYFCHVTFRLSEKAKPLTHTFWFAACLCERLYCSRTFSNPLLRLCRYRAPIVILQEARVPTAPRHDGVSPLERDSEDNHSVCRSGRLSLAV